MNPPITDTTPPEEMLSQEWAEIQTEEASSENEEIARLKEALARANADYQNLLKRVEAERAEMSAYFTQNFTKKLLPTLDNLDRVVSGTPVELQTGAVYEGVKHAATGLSKVLETMGVQSFSSVGELLNPELHEALSQGPGPEGSIVAEFEKGYKLGDTVIRHAKVVVGNGA
jgi:molecular chaperone GrpE